jgi:hypothetical protein
VRGAALLLNPIYRYITKTQNAVRKEIKTKFAGHPTIFTVGEEQVLAARLKDFAGRGFRALLSRSVERLSCFLI